METKTMRRIVGRKNMKDSHSLPNRRHFMGLMMGAGTLAFTQGPQTPALPLKNLGLEHLDIMLPDPDGLELQLFQLPAGVVGAAVPSSLPIEGSGLVTPRGLDHVVLNVTDIEKSLPYYHLMYGDNIKTTRTTNPDRLWIQLEK